MNDTKSPIPPALDLDPRTYHQAEACVHCGFCLPACPTYVETGNEADSPRGRITIMQAMADGRIEASDTAIAHLDLCLDCRACETACPSGVVYHELIEEARAKLPPRRDSGSGGGGGRLMDFVLYRLMPHPRRLRGALLPARVLQRVGLWRPVAALTGGLLGPGLAKMQRMLPQGGPLWERGLGERYPAEGEKEMTVGLLAGCVGSVLDQPTNRKTVELLRHMGCEVLVPRAQRCCGAIHHHGGHPGPAAAFAKRNIEAFEGCDRIVSNAAGCGAMLKEYDHLLRDDPDPRWSERAKWFAERVRDVSELMVELDPPPPPHRVERAVTYHDACHLVHGQGVAEEPRRLLGLIEGLEVVPLPESEMCCGAAGTYNLQQPEMAGRLAERKLRHIESTGCNACVTGNIGCSMQVRSEAAARGMKLEVLHPVDLLHEAYFGPSPA